jgi:hypothetical protein
MSSKKKITDIKYQNLAAASEIIKLRLQVEKLKLDIEKKDMEIKKLNDQKYDSSSSDDKNCYEPVNEYFEFGKYKGRSFKYVAINYPSYASWVMGLSSPSEHFRNFLLFFHKWKVKEYEDSHSP